MATASADAARDFKVHFLDMGGRKYGDCIVVECGSKTIMIDGGHAGDQRPSNGYKSIPQQLTKIFEHEPPFDISLLVVTHAHSDHIGCLPSLIADDEDENVLNIEWALLCDPDLGWGRIGGDNPFEPDALPADPVLTALREESWADVRNDALVREFLEDGITLEARYRGMIDRLRDRDARVYLYDGRRPTRLLQEFEDIGLAILGPSEDHLMQCARIIQREERVARDGLDQVMSALGDAMPGDIVERYRIAVEGLRTDLVDAGEKGASPAVNNQSIVLGLNYRGQRVLFSGDMQYGAPQTDDLDEYMTRLRRRLADSAPFSLSTLPHHGSYNGCDGAFFDEVRARNWGMCAGVGDPGHPHSKVLDFLAARRDEFQWGRTDRNGRVTFSYAGREWQMTKQRGRKNSLETNVEPDVGAPPVPPAAPATTAGGSTAPPLGSPAQALATASPAAAGEPIEAVKDFVEVTAKVPHTTTEVTITINVRPGGVAAKGPFDAGGHPPPPPPEGGPAAGIGGPPLQLAGGRTLPKLLFATSVPKLSANVGGAGPVQKIIRAITSAGHEVFNIPESGNALQAAAATAARLSALGAAGVVLLGGYDVVPPVAVDTLPPDLRPLVSPRVMGRDHDRFIVWTDAPYADVDGNRISEFPVSRIPDGRSANLLFAALQASRQVGRTWRGVRNVKRPFADHVFGRYERAGSLLRSEKATGGTPEFNIAGDQVYYMLHGEHENSSTFWGEAIDARGNTIGYPATFNVSHIPSNPPSIVLTGCCWGALAGVPIASQAAAGMAFTTRTATNSIALKYLELGTLAFVGCTGAHYSPAPPGTYFGGPMHRSFWDYVREGEPPARALWRAQRDYRARIPHGPDDPDSTAIEHKLFWQFTCLGLGW